ncbi:M4 family metallopeptidase [Lentzea aerocolonigenes]|uniref:M4 family metallopeptidase n=1 Tax=Lentzea aerocolonigenes TaxID=68170 RepID=UPI0004C341CE|nr:M4 family metallopeptidase [Lentzea aerocolonigenes]MCP2244487.1 Thermolysin metallopeptidase, catalytic domain [Lentzea aerocolonigenes]
MVCFILPTHVLLELAERGEIDLREAAKAAVASAGMHARRAAVTALVQSLGVEAELMPPPQERKVVYDAQHGVELPGVLRRGPDDGPHADKAVNDAFDNADRTYDFYRDVLGRHSVDGNGADLISTVHYRRGFDNAFWEGTQMVYGDGSGKIFKVGSLAADTSVVAHEITHGVVQFTAGLVYSKQSGALNESWADVFGSVIKQHTLGQTADQADWLLGAGILGTQLPGRALRSMKDPGTAHDFDRQPAHMDDYVDLPDNGDPRNDNGGVHINSGIPNKAFYLVATAVGGHSWEKPALIWYDALATRLQRNSQFKDAAEATVASAKELYGDDEAGIVRSAWREVGVL